MAECYEVVWIQKSSQTESPKEKKNGEIHARNENTKDVGEPNL
jgi:hypothetical protein